MRTELLDTVRFVKDMGRQYWIHRHSIAYRPSYTDGGRIELIAKYGKVQIERVVHVPNDIVPLHRHPDVDSYDFLLWGSGELWIGDKKFVMDDRTMPWIPRFISRKQWHGGKDYERGGAFLSVQYWHTEPVQSIIKNWEKGHAARTS